MSKMFSLQSPEQIAKEYGGNKQRIAQAMQMGIVDPTAGTLAGMFIDRMRGAQMQEAAQAPTVAQQVFAPPMPMGAPPAMGGLPPAPPMGGMAPPPMGAPPAMPAPPMGMADGGLAALPINDDMFDENVGDNYAGGGIVAFADAGEVDYNKILRDQLAYYSSPERMRADFYGGYQPKREASERMRRLYEGVLSEEGQKKRADEDKYFALAQLGATMASTPGSLLQAASAGLNKALPGLQEASKERRAEQRDAIKQLAADEGATNAEQREISKLVMDGRLKAADIGQALAQIRSREDLTREEIKSREKISGAEIAASRANAITAANARQGNMSDLETMVYIMEKGTPAQKAALEKALAAKQLYAPSSFVTPQEAALARLLGGAGSGGGQSGAGVINLGPINPPQR